MNQFDIIQDIVLILLVALPIIYIFKKINMPAIVGFLISGIIIGPYGFALMKNPDGIEVMAEIGVILLLFTIGLEVSFTQLIKIRKFLLIAGGIQVAGTILIAALILSSIGLSSGTSIFIGMLVSLSSTAIVLKILSDRQELRAPHGKISLGILIFQDLIIVPMFLLLPILGASEPLSFKEIILKMLLAFGTLAGLLFLAKFLMPKIMYILAGIRLREAFTTGTILILLGTAYLTHSFGLSFALGAFIAGLILAESEYNSQIISDMLPLKDTFNSIFFVSVGMLLNVNFVLDNPLFILIVTAAVIIFKSFIITIIVLFLRYPLRIALLTALGLSQIGEFAFVLSQAGSKTGLFDNQLYNIFLASSIFTMILTPFLIKLAPKLAFASSSLVPVRENGEDEETKNLTGQVVIAGFGLNGKNLARVLKQTGIRYIVTELNPDTVKIEKANNERIIFGDISKEEVLHQVHIENASVLVFTISDPITTRRSLYSAKRINPKIFTVVRTRYLNEIEELKKLGADAVIPEEFETSLEIFRNVLERYHIPLNVIMQQTSILRSESYSLLRNDESAASFIHLDEILAQGLTETFFVNQDNPNAGRLLSEIHLREHSDATIIAIVRDGKTISNPTGRQKILINDTLVITGTHKSVDAAINILSRKED